MGRRTRKRSTAPAPRPLPAARTQGRDARPPSPWGSFPLVELCVLLAMVIAVAGLLTGGERGLIMIVTGCVLGSLAGLDVSVREHFAGFRSHTTVLAGVPTVVLMGVLFAVRAPWALLIAIGAGTFVTAFWVLRGAFRRRSGGLSYR